MKDPKSIQSLHNLGNALQRLREALEVPEDSILAVDGTIQRFEFAIELYWKTLKRLLAQEGVHTNTPRETLQHAFQVHWLEDETAWLQMLRDRNETSHVYDEATAVRIYRHIKQYFPEMERTYTFLLQRFEESD
ncbi:HI0074 family nucleotidyltransferase substrate-binding subunit [Effusibacillus dendaii]|uniref:Nucleotidyltransferase n=1 Tax=Effusibacillus dendaii TaxID=2743772 RepID=A0A7I8DH77_9BACL|nr:HI0074 family nucleotidyltransferase substrate-binding subunit [Effusibacillus dendaii]BCJ87161.1 nucleotidyltransferase [Effusibacillus dendaii]